MLPLVIALVADRQLRYGGVYYCMTKATMLPIIELAHDQIVLLKTYEMLT